MIREGAKSTRYLPSLHMYNASTLPHTHPPTDFLLVCVAVVLIMRNSPVIPHFPTLQQIAHLLVSVAVVLIMRYSPAVSGTYDADLDTLPRAALIAPPLVLALVFNKVQQGGELR